MSRIQKGFTLIELIIVIAIIGVIAAIAIPVITGASSPSVSYGVTGWTEERCISGFKFVTGNRGAPAQILDAQGHGIPCQ